MRKTINFFYFNLLFLIVCKTSVFSQGATNINPKIGYVNVNIPRTPESAGFEKYGNTQVSEFTGTTNIGIPIYTLKSRFLESPVTLSYQSNPVRVNQESSWVGLGFDLNAGGRISVETRGGVDFSSQTYFLAGEGTRITGMGQIFSRLGNPGENAVFTPATFCPPNSSCSDPNFYNGMAISDMTQYGVGEPDIFRANFLGHSITFFIDKISRDIKFIGEKSSFSILPNIDPSHNIVSWAIRDNDGITYLFEQTESTTSTLLGSAVVPATTTSAWLLTKMTHPSGDYIRYIYSNFGPSVPAFSMNSNIDYAFNSPNLTVSSEIHQNVFINNPYYLTRMETSTVALDFILATRTDLYGSGSRKLSQITVTDKITNSVKKTASFTYSYFQAPINPSSRGYLNSLDLGLQPSLNMNNAGYLATSSLRLRLDEVAIGNETAVSQAPYKFYYNGAVVDKYSLSQDHWGYFNGVDNSSNGYRFTHLIPQSFFGSPLSANSQILSAVGSQNLGFSRDCNGTLMQAMMLYEIVYPTGGKSVFTYEPHQSTMSPTIPVTGGGLRVKTIKNYVGGDLTGTTEYSYSGGKYMGTIKYYTTDNFLTACGNGISGHARLTSSGELNANDILVGYSQISVTQKDNLDQSIGYLVKTFDITTASSNYSNNGSGIDIAPPYFSPNETNPPYSSPWIPSNYASFLDISYKLLPPTPSANLEGKLKTEKYYDNTNNLLKTVEYFYHLANYSNNFYSVRAIQNREGGFDISCPGNPSYGASTAMRAVNLFVSPAKTFNVQLYSKVETNFANGNSLITTTNFTYDSYNQLKTAQVNTSDGKSKIVTYSHPYDNLQTYYFLMSAHIYSTVISTTEAHNTITDKFVKYNFFNPSSGVFVPQSIEMQIAGNPLETRELYNAYDVYGNLLEKQKPSGIKEVYLWGYDKQFPVASVKSANSYSTVSGLVDPLVLDAPASDAALRLELNKIRTGLPNAIVTTYTYDRIYGITSETDARGRTSYYSYDGMGKLSVIYDNEGNILKKICYNYAGQVEDCTLTSNTTPVWRGTGQTRCQPCASNPNFNSGVREKEEKDINPSSLTANSSRWVVDPSGTCPSAPPIYQPRNDLAYCEQISGINTGNFITPTWDANQCSSTYNTNGPSIITPNHPPCMPCTIPCNVPQYKCINGVCTAGLLKVVKFRRINKFTWECYKAWCFPDGSLDGNNLQTFTSSTPCDIECF